MQVVRARRVDRLPRRAVAPGRASRRHAPAVPAWRLLTVTLVLGMAAWAIGLLELPDYRRLADWVGGLAILTILVVWVRRNGAALACEPITRGDGGDRLEIRVIRSRRPPPPDFGGPDITAPRHRVLTRR